MLFNDDYCVCFIWIYLLLLFFFIFFSVPETSSLGLIIEKGEYRDSKVAGPTHKVRLELAPQRVKNKQTNKQTNINKTINQTKHNINTKNNHKTNRHKHTNN